VPEPYRNFSSKVVPLRAENVDTDQIVPARYLKITDKAGLAEVLFRDWRFDEQGCFLDPLFVLDQPGMAGRNILLAGANFGTGSSREHAPWALAAWGIKAVISTGYADIFRSNALKNGVLPISVDPETHAHLFALVDDDPDSELRIDLGEQGILLPDGTTIEFDVDTFARLMLLRGTDEIGYLVEALPAIEAWEADHPARVDTRPDAATAGPIA
jgi:3-isopropylmalate/(R)-2-methylmalate dehydratase small subunit